MPTKKIVSETPLMVESLPAKQKPEVKMRKRLPKSQVYIFTAAQNATPVHKHFWEALMQLKEYRNAELVVTRGRYKNPTSRAESQKNDSDEWWDPILAPYLFSGRQRITNRLILLSDIKIEWASNSPLSGMDGFTKNMCGIVGHGNRALNSIAVPQYKNPKIMVTTGACTVPNYSDTKRGKLGEFNHCLGALIVEVDVGSFHVREINWSESKGCFIDLDTEFTPQVVRPAERAISLTMGDTHYRFIAPHVVEATFTARESMVKLLRPQYLVWHDLMDFHSRNHHHRDDWLTRYTKWKDGKEDVRQEVEEAIRFVKKMTPCDTKSVVVSSNHLDALARWLKETDFRFDPVNTEFFLELAAMVAKTARMGAGGAEYDDPFSLYGEKHFARENLRFLRQNESLVLAGVEHGLHGDRGPNGARGTTKNLSTIGVKVTKGHDHSAKIIGGCYSGGVSTGPLEYEKGPNSHANAHVVEYANGKRAILFIINGRYCLKQSRPRRKG